MKKTYLFALCAVMALFSACSSDDSVTAENKQPEYGFAPDGTGYLNVNIVLPSRTSSSRAENDKFDDGIAEEYAVRNATLLLFNGTSEATATFASAYDLKVTMEEELPKNNQITRNAVKIQKLSSKPTNTIYALVVLNHNNLLSVDANGSLYVDGTGQAFNKTEEMKFTGTLQNFVEKTATNPDLMHKNGFFMTNAILSYESGNSATTPTKLPALLAPVQDNHIYTSSADATAGKGVLSICVERGVAKVSLKDNITIDKNSGAGLIEAGEYLTPKVEGWFLQNVNQSSYLFRHWDTYLDGTDLKSNWIGYKIESVASNPYRFFGTTAIAVEAGVNLYRTYWAKDPNYDNNYDSSPETFATTYEAKTQNMKDKYCYENTFPTKYQKVVHTTYATVAVSLAETTVTKDGDVITKVVSTSPAADFYCLNGEVNKLYRENDMKTQIAQKIVALYKADELFPEGHGSGTVNVHSVKFNDGGTTKEPSEMSAGKHEIAEITFRIGTSTADADNVTLKTGMNEEKLKALIGAIEIDKYANGIAYYDVLIQHFASSDPTKDLAPWNSDGKTSGVPYESTPNDAKYLGRYGVVRNNWYDIQVDGVRRIGTSTPPTYTGKEWDDDIESYLKMKISVLSWAKRTQTVTLQ